MADEPEAVKQDEGALVGNGAEAEVNAPGGTAQRKPSDEEVVKKLKEVLETVSLDVTGARRMEGHSFSTCAIAFCPRLNL